MDKMDDATKKAIIEQIEFYFSDANFPFDKFLYTLAQRNPEGHVDLATLCSFKRMKAPFTSVYGLDAIRDVIREATTGPTPTSSLVQLSEDGSQIRRVKPLVKDETASGRTDYVKRFVTVETEHNTHQQM